MPSLNTGNAILSNAIAVDSSYNVGIGGAASGSYKLQVTGTSNLTGALTGTSASFTSGVTLATTSGVLAINTTGRPAGVGGGDNGKVWSKQATSGNYGIATIASATDSFTYIGHNGTDALLGTSYGTTGAYTDLVIQTADVTRFRLSGSTGAATFNTSFTTAITMESSASASGLRLKNNGGTASDWIIQSDGGVAATAAFRIYSVTADAYRMAILGNGNVGIGTTSPNSALQVGDFSGNNVISIGAATNGVSSLYFGDGSGAALYIGFLEYNHTGDFMRIGTNGAERIRVNGNSERTQVLIGTDTPIYSNTNRGQLVVNGIASSLIGLQRNGGGAIGYLYADANSFQIAADSGVDILMYPQSAIKAGVDNTYTMGASGARWSAIWAANGTIQTSDARQKKDITNSNLGLDFINKLRPVSYKWIVGGNSVETCESDNENEVVKRTITANEGKRNHYGLIAQEVKEVLGDIDFGGYVYDEETDTMALRYDQFISPMIKAIQELTQKVNEQQQTINSLINR
jgi:hypothetical protein